MLLKFIVGYFIIGFVISILCRLIEGLKYSLAEYLAFVILWPILFCMILLDLLDKLKL
jgi:hypothetical protein